MGISGARLAPNLVLENQLAGVDEGVIVKVGVGGKFQHVGQVGVVAVLRGQQRLWSRTVDFREAAAGELLVQLCGRDTAEIYACPARQAD